MGYGISCFVCTRSDLISGDVARVLDLRPWEAPFVDRIVFASIVASAVTVWGEDLLPRVAVPSVRRRDVFKAFFGFSSQVVLSAVTFPVLPDASRPCLHPDFRFGCGTFTHPSSRHALISAGSARGTPPERVTPCG